MARTLRFQSAWHTDPSERAAHPNGLAGRDLVRRLGDALAQAGCSVTPPDAEDWGWYVEAIHQGRVYTVGATLDDDSQPPEWVVQIDLHQSMLDRLRRRNAMRPDDAVAERVEHVLRHDAETTALTVDGGA